MITALLLTGLLLQAPSPPSLTIDDIMNEVVAPLNLEISQLRLERASLKKQIEQLQKENAVLTARLKELTSHR